MRIAMCMRIRRGACERRDGGVYVLTEETQNGWLASLGRWNHRWLWLERLQEVARRVRPFGYRL